jgi:hypothetical protein
VGCVAAVALAGVTRLVRARVHRRRAPSAVPA